MCGEQNQAWSQPKLTTLKNAFNQQLYLLYGFV